MHVLFFVVDQSKRRNRAGGNSKVLHHPFGRSKRELTLFQPFFQVMDVKDLCVC